MNILVTGGAGYIGSHCCKELFLSGYKPVVIDNLIYGHRENVRWGDFFEGDVGKKADLMECFTKSEIHAVMHFAAFAYVGESMVKPMKYYENNLRNTINMLQMMLEKGIRYLVFSSSCATYGNPVKLPIDEAHPQRPINPYGRTKYMIEEILRDCDKAYGMRFMSLRYFNAAGADPEGEVGEDHEPETHLIPLVLRAALDPSKPVSVFGRNYPTKDGTCIRDYIHVKDLASAHVLALDRLLKGQDSEFYNLGTGHGYSVMEVVEKAGQVTGKKIPYQNRARREGDPPVLVASNKKAINDLGWRLKWTSLESILETAWLWHAKKQRIE
jgi:UDP-glucose 4-epimerase